MSAFYGKAAEWEVWTLSWGMTMRGTDQGTITERAQHKHSAVYWHMCSQANQQRVSIEWFGSGLYSSYGSKYRYNCGIHQLRLEHTYISYLAVSRGRMCASTTLTRKAHRDEGTDTCSPATANTSVAGPSAIDNRQSTTALQISAC